MQPHGLPDRRGDQGISNRVVLVVAGVGVVAGFAHAPPVVLDELPVVRRLVENLARQVGAGDGGGLLLVVVVRRVVLVRGRVGKVAKVDAAVVAAVEVIPLELGRRPLRRRHRLVPRVGCPAREPSNESPHPRHLLRDGNVDRRLGFFGEPFVVHDQPDATVPLPAPVRVPTALRDPAQRVRPNPSEQSERQDRVRAQHDVEPPHCSRGPSNSGMDVLEVLVQPREVLAPPDPVPAVGVDPALVLRVDEQRRLQVCARSRVRGLGVCGVSGRRRASGRVKLVLKSGLSKEEVLAFCWFRGAAFERTEEEEGESAAGVLAGHEGVHALPPVVAALLPRPLLRFRDDLALQVDQQVAEFREPGAGGGDRPGGRLDRSGVPLPRGGPRGWRGDVRWRALVLGPVSLRGADHRAERRRCPQRSYRGERPS